MRKAMKSHSDSNSARLEQALVYLIRTKRFFAECLLRMEKVETKDIETAGVTIENGGFKLLYNPHFINQYTHKEAAAILQHECEHLLRDHLDKKRQVAMEPEMADTKQSTLIDKLERMGKHELMNMAQDYEINEFLDDLPQSFKVFDKEGKPIVDKEGKEATFRPCLVGDLEKQLGKELKRKQPMEYYYSLLKAEAKKNPKPMKVKVSVSKGDGNGDEKGEAEAYVSPIDSHDELDKSAQSMDSEMAKDLVKNLANDAFNSLLSKDRGEVPGHIIQAMDELNKKTKDWRKDFRKFKETCSAILVEETRRRRNRRYGLLYPGRRAKPKLHLWVGIDTSGSVDDVSLKQCLSELKAMHKLGVKITVLECDWHLNNVYEFDPKRKIKVKGRGGTSFEPVFAALKDKKFIKEHGKPDGLIYLTDGDDYGNMVDRPKVRVLWALLPNCRVRYTWGDVTHIEVQDKKRRV